MAKVSFNKLGITKSKLNNVKTIVFNEQEIEVKQYLPVNQKLELIGNVISYSADENNFANPVKLEVWSSLEIIYQYTNLTFTEKQKEDEILLYDMLTSSGLIALVKANIPEKELEYLTSNLYECANAIYTYRNSVLGILEAVSTEYENLNLDTQQIQETIQNPETMNLVKGVLTDLIPSN